MPAPSLREPAQPRGRSQTTIGLWGDAPRHPQPSPTPRENAHLAFPSSHSSTLGGWLRRHTLTKPLTQAEAATGGKNPTAARDKDAEVLLPTVWSPLAHPLIRVMGALPRAPGSWAKTHLGLPVWPPYPGSCASPGGGGPPGGGR